jgi:protein SCO1/2
MAGRAMNARTAFIAALLLLAGCDRTGSDRPPLAGAALGGPFALTDQAGRAVTDQSYAGRYRAVYFGYTFCPDVCPTTLQMLMQGVHGFARDEPGRAARLVPIFVTVDPARDTPAVMKAYVSAFGPELVGLTGTPAQIEAMEKRYGVYAKKIPQAAGASGYLMDHSNQVILFDPKGAPIALIPTDQGADRVSAELAKWVR